MAGRKSKAAGTATTDAATPTAPLDFSNLTADDIEPDEVRHTRTTKVDRSPFMGWLKETYENDTAKSVTVSAAHVDEVKSLLNGAARRFNIGVRIALVDAGDGNVTVKFRGVERREYTPRSK